MLQCRSAQRLVAAGPVSWSNCSNIKAIMTTAASFEIEYLITSTAKDGSEILHAKGKSVQVMIDIALKKPIELPEWLRKDITAYEPALD